MASYGPFSPATVVSDNSIGTFPWSNPGNAVADDSSYATNNIGPEYQISEYLKATNYAAAMAQPIPSDSRIISIVLDVKRKCDIDMLHLVYPVGDYAVRMVIGGSIQTADTSSPTPWTATDGYFSYAWTSNLPTPAQVNASDFGFALSMFSSQVSQDATARVNHMRLRVNLDSDDEMMGSGT